MLKEHAGPWTERDYLALGGTSNRIELFDGSLWVCPAPDRRHQQMSHLLGTALRQTTRAAGLRIVTAVTVRLSTDRLVVPDLVIADLGRLVPVVDSADVVLVAEITSPSSAAVDQVQKMHFYAAAGIKWYLLVEPDTPDQESIRLRLYRLWGEHYVEHAAADHGETLTSGSPFPIELSTDDLLDP